MHNSGREENLNTDEDNRSMCSSDSGSDPDSDSGQLASKFWGHGNSSSSSSDNEDQDEDNGKSSTRSLQECIRSEEEERVAMSLDPDYAWEKIRSSQTFLEPPVKILSSDTEEKPRSNRKNYCRFVFISDTHGRHRDIAYLPRGDVLVHSGDFTKSGETGTIEDLSAYFGELINGTEDRNGNADDSVRRPHFSKVICVAGNHDLTLDQEYYDREWQRFHREDSKFDPATAQTAIRRHAIYLHDESHTIDVSTEDDINSSTANFTTRTINVWGSPYSPKYFNWGFMKERGAPIREIWDQIPSKGDPNPVDVLITHGPPLGRGDLAGTHGATTRAGCYDLLRAIQDKIQPKINVFGHIHENFGVTYDGTTLYVNASTMNKSYETVHLPIVIDVPFQGSSESSKVVRPSSLFCNATTYITSVEEWIQWCRQHGHWQVADALQNGLSVETAEKWFVQRREPTLDQFLHEIATEMEFNERPTRESRRQLATMVFHLYALAFEDKQLP